MNLDELLRSEVVSFVLEASRISGVIIAAPLAWVAAPVRIRIVLVLALTFAVHGFADVPELGPVDTAWAIITEFSAGIAIGMVVRFSIAVAEMVATAIGPVMGLGAAQILDPQSGTQVNVLSRLMRYFAILLALIVGLHRTLIAAMLASFDVMPIGSVVDPGDALPAILELSGACIETGVRIALPVIALLLMVQLALGFISRAAPTMQIFSVGFAATLSVGAIALIITVPDMAMQLVAEFSHDARHFERVIGEMMPQ